MRIFEDIENGGYITESELKAEFNKLKAEQPNEYNYSFENYIQNCTNKNGFIQEVAK